MINETLVAPAVARHGELVGRGGPAVPRLRYRPWLHRYTILVALTIVGLICIGGMVTSRNAGLTVPDWPNSYGYSMFLFPVSRWVGGVFYEHVHRLAASVVGLLTLGLSLWVWLAEKGRPRLRVAGLLASAAVILQGVLGGLRVVWRADEIGIFHACLAQAFLVLVCLVAVVTSRRWVRGEGARAAAAVGAARSGKGFASRLPALRWIALTATVLVYVQLAFGATMRHKHAGLSIPDFPTAYGQVWPPTDTASVARINAAREQTYGLPPTDAGQIILQMVHRAGALLVGLTVVAGAVAAWAQRRRLSPLTRRLAWIWPALIAGQISLGVATIWTNKAADVATSHVALGAASLVWGAVLTTWLFRERAGYAVPAASARGSGGSAHALRPGPAATATVEERAEKVPVAV